MGEALRTDAVAALPAAVGGGRRLLEGERQQQLAAPGRL